MRNPRRTMAATVLVAEALVVLFAALVAMRLSGAGTTASLTAFGALALLCLLCAGLLRSRAGYLLGSVLQLAVVAGGVLVPLMYGVGALFAVLWFAALRIGTRIEREQAEVARRSGS